MTEYMNLLTDTIQQKYKKRKKKRLYLYVPEYQEQAFRLIADDLGLKLSELLEKIFEEYLDDVYKKEKARFDEIDKILETYTENN